MILTMITFGIYWPWFQVTILQYVYANTTMGRPVKGAVEFEFTGTGGKLFVIVLVGFLLTMITFGIYGAWFATRLMNYMADHSIAKGSDQTVYRFKYNGTGGKLFVKFLVGYLLTLITFGIYGAWFACDLYKYLFSNTEVVAGETKLGAFDFVGRGGEFFVIGLVGILLTMITFGIYYAWFMTKVCKFMTTNTRANLAGVTYAGSFGGEGGQLFVKLLVGTLLTMITFGIYGAWFMVDVMRWRINHTGYQVAGASAPAA